LSITGSPFTHSGLRTFTPPGSNGDGDGGWVLVLETNPPPDLPPPPPMPRFVQQNYATPQTPQIQVSAPYPNAQIAGNANLLAIGWNDTVAGINSVSDSAGNTYRTAIPTYRGNGLSQAICYATHIPAGTNTVTVVFDAPAVYVDLRVTEYSGLRSADAFDAGMSASGSGTAYKVTKGSVPAIVELLVESFTLRTFLMPYLLRSFLLSNIFGRFLLLGISGIWPD